MRLRLVREPFDHPDYIFELEHDGFRAIAYLQNGESKLVSRNQRNLGFETLKRSLAKLPVENAILDGEIICVDAQGVSQFNQLLSRKGEPVFYAFDLLWLDGKDLRQMPLVERKKRLARLVRAAKCSRLLYAQHIEQQGKGFSRKFAPATLRGLWRSGNSAFTRTTHPAG
jgi:bifunctional non-homologous end joining protein LigD